MSKSITVSKDNVGDLHVCRSQIVEKAVRPQGIKDKETNIKNSHAGVKTTGETGGLHSPYKGQLQAEPLKGAQKV